MLKHEPITAALIAGIILMAGGALLQKTPVLASPGLSIGIEKCASIVDNACVGEGSDFILHLYGLQAKNGLVQYTLEYWVEAKSVQCASRKQGQMPGSKGSYAVTIPVRCKATGVVHARLTDLATGQSAEIAVG
ncbi:hypothetical protein COV94_06330 [Candidatus Woesearchaeota archaeon CG11_big_fil_rev_8_21_14_0_20_57_5]|nr:MAG: hypothetical protein COV94_06330 [Candidatus Woesearchaeota archaeon CG11_big_fil_rev_8_21_14_0_20_57_5]